MTRKTYAVHHFLNADGFANLTVTDLRRWNSRTIARDSRLLREAHLRHLSKLNAMTGNIGWVVTASCYVSKTPAGIIETTRTGNRKYTHKVLPK